MIYKELMHQLRKFQSNQNVFKSTAGRFIPSVFELCLRVLSSSECGCRFVLSVSEGPSNLCWTC